MIEDVKRIPYGVSNFVEVVEQNQYYVDKTMYLPLLEQQPNSLFFIRPRRFGKSLTLSMLESYYDINNANRFEELFGERWIYQHPTALRAKFLILRFNFSTGCLTPLRSTAKIASLILLTATSTSSPPASARN